MTKIERTKLIVKEDDPVEENNGEHFKVEKYIRWKDNITKHKTEKFKLLSESRKQHSYLISKNENTG
jgi:hypothetical protein